MKVGDLVKYVGLASSSRIIQGAWSKTGTGIIIGFDEDNDPAVFWQSDGIVGQCGEYHLQIEVINESR